MIKVLFNNIFSKILLIIFLFFGFGNMNLNASCEFPDDVSKYDIKKNVDDCFRGSKLLVDGDDVTIETGFKTKLISWIKIIAQVLSVVAVGSIVYGGLLMTISTGEDEKIKKGKDVVKWGMLGFLAVISAGALIALIVNTIYGVVK